MSVVFVAAEMLAVPPWPRSPKDGPHAFDDPTEQQPAGEICRAAVDIHTGDRQYLE